MAVVVVCGLPGSGKSSLCSLIQQGSGEREVVTLDFDTLCDSSSNDKGDGGEQDDGTTWKTQRQAALHHLEKSVTENKRRVVLVDDTMHLRSMRREVYQIAREAGLGFGVIYVDVAWETCIKRDEARCHKNHIGRDIILNMLKRFEIPSQPWEDPFLHIHNPSPLESCMEQCEVFIRACMDAPLLSYASQLAQKSEDQEATLADRQHQLDLSLRKEVALCLKSSQLRPTEKQSFAKHLGCLKKKTLEGVKGGALGLDEALSWFKSQASTMTTSTSPST